MERADLAAGVPARDERDVVPAAALPEGRARQARRLLHPRLQPGVDQPGRVQLDRGAHRRVEDRPARGAHADLERDGLLRRLRAADGPRLRAPRPALVRDARRAVDRLPPAGAAGGPARGSAGRSSDTREVNPGEVWEENEFWIELSWRIDPDGALGIRKYFESKREPGDEADGRRVLRLHLRELGAGPARARARPRARRRSSTCAATAPSRSRARSARSTRRACPRPSSRTCGALPAARLRAERRSRPRRTSCPCRRPIRTRTAAGRSGSTSTARSCAASRRRAGKLEFYSSTLKAWGWPEHALPGYIRSHVHPESLEPGRDAADPDLPAAGPDPHAQREREVARRDRPHEPALDPPDARRRGSASRPATWCASRRASATSS